MYKTEMIQETAIATLQSSVNTFLASSLCASGCCRFIQCNITHFNGLVSAVIIYEVDD